MNTVQFSEKLTNLSNEVQLRAAQGLLSCRVYKQSFDKTIAYSFATAILSSFAVPATLSLAPALPIFFGVGALASLAYTIYQIYERSVFKEKTAILEPVFKAIRTGWTQGTYNEFQKKLPNIFSIEKDAEEAHLKLESWGAKFLSADFFIGNDPNLKAEFITKFNFDLLVLDSIHKVTALKYLPEKDYQALAAKIRFHGNSLRGGIEKTNEALALLEHAKTESFLVGKFEKDTAKLLWDHLIDTFRELKPESFNRYEVKNVRNHVLYLQQFYPLDGYEKLFATCHSIADFSKAAKSMPKTRIANVDVNGLQKPQLEWKLSDYTSPSIKTLSENDLKATRSNNQLIISLKAYNVLKITSFDYLWDVSKDGTLSLLIVPKEKEKCAHNAVKQTAKNFMETFPNTWENFTIDLQKFGQVKTIHIHGIESGVCYMGPTGNPVQATAPSIKRIVTIS